MNIGDTLQVRFASLFRRADIWLVFLIALALRLGFFRVVVGQISTDSLVSVAGDSVHYVQLARDFIHGTSGASDYLCTWGPGFSAFLAVVFTFFGEHWTFLTLVQILLSSLSCVLLYAFTFIVTRSYLAAFIAAILLAASLTAISLSVMILSETLYVFVFLAGLTLYISALQTGRWRLFIVSAVFTGYAILVRSVGQYWPAAMLVIAVLFVFEKRAARDHGGGRINRVLLSKVLICVGLVLAIEGAWMTRNYVTHGTFFLTTAGSGGMANVAAMACERMDGRAYREIRAQWQAEYMKEHHLSRLSPVDARRADTEKSSEILRRYPIEVFAAYMSTVWRNLNEVNRLNRTLLPAYKAKVVQLEYFFLDNRLNYLPFILSIAGLLLLLVKRNFMAAVIFGVTYAYFVSSLGFTLWQGSRLFLPGQVAALPLIGVSILSVMEFVRSLAARAIRVFPRFRDDK